MFFRVTDIEQRHVQVRPQLGGGVKYMLFSSLLGLGSTTNKLQGREAVTKTLYIVDSTIYPAI